MKNHLIKISFVSLITVCGLIFIAGQSLDYFVFKFRQTTIRQEIKREIKQGVKESELHSFKMVDVFLSDAVWLKPGKEFKLDGKMYDVVRTDIVNGRKVFKCIDDTQEAKLFAELDELVKKRLKNSGDDELKNLTKDFLKVFYDAGEILWIPSKTLSSCFIPFSFLSFSLNNLPPPPRLYS